MSTPHGGRARRPGDFTPEPRVLPITAMAPAVGEVTCAPVVERGTTGRLLGEITLT